MDLSIIIVNWNSKDYLKNCISSIVSTTKDIEYEIVVIDNGSFDGSGQMLAEHYTQVRFIQSENNLGFAKANNAAYKVSTGQQLLFLNPDTELVGPAINTLYNWLNVLPDAGIVGCKLLNGDLSVQTSCIQSFPTILNQFLDSEFLRERWPRSPLWGNASLFAAHTDPQEVEAISGACIMVNRSAFEQIGLFSEDYFMYAEDLDLCYKSRQAGYKNYYVPETAVVHFGGGSTHKDLSDHSVVMMRESMRWFFGNKRGKVYGIAYRLSTLISAIGRILLLLIVAPHCLVKKEIKSWNTAFRKWRAILLWSLGVRRLGNRTSK